MVSAPGAGIIIALVAEHGFTLSTMIRNISQIVCLQCITVFPKCLFHELLQCGFSPTEVDFLGGCYLSYSKVRISSSFFLFPQKSPFHLDYYFISHSFFIFCVKCQDYEEFVFALDYTQLNNSNVCVCEILSRNRWQGVGHVCNVFYWEERGCKKEERKLYY